MSEGQKVHRSTSSLSSYEPVIINPTPDTSFPSTSSTTNHVPSKINLKYPYPLSVLVVADIAYITHHTLQHSVPIHILILTAIRGLVILVGVGCSQRWRSRGGWVAAGNGASIGAAIWEDCANQLKRKGRFGDNGQSLFLYTTVLICALEYIIFLFLLRLSPPNHRIQPLSLRLPASSRQTETPFEYSSEELPPTPRSIRHRRQSSQAQSSRAGLFDANHLASDDEDEVQMEDQSDENEDDAEEGEEEEEDPYLSDSTISESSIIDLPPPLEPQRIIPPSMSMRSNLTLALDSSPMLGPLMRRSRSTRFLGRSWGSQASDLERRFARYSREDNNEEEERTYGTFGNSGAAGQSGQS